ncbi:hypothetical protein [Nocardia sp. BMG51109]|uniref:hypothetical protein n=1 Tax=Nocardia sp. BMG51109 TaxID=1056816 RepID=UPI0012EC19BB|nr:hypothetical protein [Nocardia sp. BMG51109]
MYEWNDRLEQDYRRYVGDKWFQGLNARDRKGYQEARNQWQRAREVGNRFRDGMAFLRGQTPERGYEKEVRVKTDRGPRIQDVANREIREGSEYKSGRVDKEKTLPQLDKEERLIIQGWRLDWTTVEGARIDREVQDRVRELTAKYPDRFKIQEVSREQLRLALTVAKNLEKQRKKQEREHRQREKEKAQQRAIDERAVQRLTKSKQQVKTYELHRADRARKRLEHIREIVKARDRSEGFQAIQKFRDAADRGRTAGRAVPQQEERQRDEHQREVPTTPARAERERIIQLAKERAVREWRDEWLGLKPREQSGRHTQQERERQERETREREAADAAVHKARKAAAARLAVVREQEREAFERGQRLPMDGREIADLLAVTQPTPTELERARERPAPEMPRGRDKELGRERTRERDR